MVRIAIVITSFLALAGTTAIDVSVARAQSSAFDKCMARCKQSGITNRCPYWCESRNRR